MYTRAAWRTTDSYHVASAVQTQTYRAAPSYGASSPAALAAHVMQRRRMAAHAHKHIPAAHVHVEPLTHGRMRGASQAHAAYGRRSAAYAAHRRLRTRRTRRATTAAHAAHRRCRTRLAYGRGGPNGQAVDAHALPHWAKAPTYAAHHWLRPRSHATGCSCATPTGRGTHAGACCTARTLHPHGTGRRGR